LIGNWPLAHPQPVSGYLFGLRLFNPAYLEDDQAPSPGTGRDQTHIQFVSGIETYGSITI